jgi:hypothetical protein
MSFYEIFKKDELNDGEMKMKEINGHEYMIARVGDNYYASDNCCPHMGGKFIHGQIRWKRCYMSKTSQSIRHHRWTRNTMDRLVRNQIIIRQSIEVSKKSKNI